MFEILDKKCTPTKGTEFSACVDLYAREDIVIGAGETVLVPLGVKIDIEKIEDGIDSIYPYNEGMLPKHKLDYFMKTHQLNLHIRSSMSAKHGLVIANGTGIIDLDYPGEIMICLHNPLGSLEFYQDYTDQSKKPVKIKKGQPIAQISLVEHKSYLFGVDSEEKRVGGFGSTNA